jgi:outer membrane protein assembly factor BamB
MTPPRRILLTAAGLALLAGPATTVLASQPSSGPGTLVTACQTHESWPMYQGNQKHTANACSQINASNVSQLRPSWFLSTNGTVTATPAVANGTVYDGDSTGRFYAINQSDGALDWTFQTTSKQTCFVDAKDPYADTHHPGFGEITSSPALATIAGRPTVFVGAGASLFALNATTGQCMWAQDTDPGKPTSAIEIESSPVVDTAVDPPEVIVGNDDNSGAGIAVTGIQAFNAKTGALLWKYQPERDVTLTPGEFGGSDALTLSCGDGSVNPYCTGHGLAPNSTAYADACGDVWSSPALDTNFTDPAGDNTYQGWAPHTPTGWTPKQITSTGKASPDGLVVFGTGNCAANPNPSTAQAHGDYVDNQGIFALDPVTGVRAWNFVVPYDQYDNNTAEPGAGDDDFGSSAILARLPAGAAACPAGARKTTTLVIEGSKNGTAYGVCESNGHKIWQNQIAQPGQLSPDFVGSAGGMLGSASAGVASRQPAVFFTSAVPLPFSNDGVRQPGDGDSNISSCPGTAPAPTLPACPDLSILNNPQRIVSLHAVNAATGTVIYQAPSLPTYAASSYTNGVVFLPDSTAFGVAAFNADNGNALWAFPLAAVPASGAAIAGNSIFLGTGEGEGSIGPLSLPPQATGIWSFSL